MDVCDVCGSDNDVVSVCPLNEPCYNACFECYRVGKRGKAIPTVVEKPNAIRRLEYEGGIVLDDEA